MKKLSLRNIALLISLAILVLVGLQLYQSVQLYHQKSDAYSKRIENTLSSLVIKHEKASDFRNYAPIFGQEFRTQYKSALIEEFQNLFPVEESVSITDTIIVEQGEPQNYYYIYGKSFDSLSGVTATHSVLVKDMNDGNAMKYASSTKDSLDIAGQLDRRVKTQLFSKSKFVNQKMIDIFRNISSQTPQQRIDLAFLDTVIQNVLRQAKINSDYTYAITDKNGDIIPFPAYTDKYDLQLSKKHTYAARLFPGNVFDADLFLNIHFNEMNVELFSEMWLTLLVSILLISLVITSFIVLFKTILKQKRLSEVKNDFINNMTHEFKTPISTISLACEALTDKDMMASNPDAVLPFVGMINDENKRLGNLVERILQSAVIDKGEIKLKREALDLNEIVSKVVGKAKLRMDAKHGQFKLNLAPGSIPFTGDHVHTTNIISNLVDNAIKYSKEQASITITTEKTEKYIRVSVADTGIGIKAEHLDKVFDKLYRVPTGNLHDVKGFGLGLSYVKAIADLEGWQVNAESTFGKGSTFTITINK
ncbi:HAMP domain-containing sensor histidine kinase [Lishizhenia sp.]|uniref:sensor histidine kinase n=1 Tax=Lishizhenia sp. TaxID=2497594 RepID=UPI00299E1AAB|nr:HAMP domain-containing sensor histidine kinase [Lishizhenia sp.]MDX1447307.1 HAMP domain-containing sensor histidine kinase [Lishizhenia sp.]